MGGFVENWSHTMNSKTGNVQINIPIDKGDVISIEVSEKDLKHMKQWFDIERHY